MKGLSKNEERYGPSPCPCRLPSGKFELDRDIICPCDYRDPDVREYGCYYCTLYVRKDVFKGKTPIKPIPERRPLEKQVRAYAISARLQLKSPLKELTFLSKNLLKAEMKMWHCKQCGYVCFREDPYVCPICKAKREMFAEITIRTDIRR